MTTTTATDEGDYQRRIARAAEPPRYSVLELIHIAHHEQRWGSIKITDPASSVEPRFFAEHNSNLLQTQSRLERSLSGRGFASFRYFTGRGGRIKYGVGARQFTVVTVAAIGGCDALCAEGGSITWDSPQAARARCHAFPILPGCRNMPASLKEFPKVWHTLSVYSENPTRHLSTVTSVSVARES